jgi:hypothetical protein
MTARGLIAGLAVALAARAAHAKGCHEVSDVVGYHHCTRFGIAWSREADTPRITVELGHYFRHFEARPFTLDDTPVSTGGATDWHATADGEYGRVLAGIGPYLYAGVEFDGGGLDRLPRTTGTAVGEGTELVPLAVAGVHVIERYRVALSAELAAGVRYDDYAACGTEGCPDTSQLRTALEARAHVSIFFHPQLSVDLGYGHSLLDAHDRIFTFSVAVHGRVMDGMR